MIRPKFTRCVAAATLLGVLLASRAAAAVEPLEGTAPLEAEGDLASAMVDGIDRFLLRETAESVGRRKAFWQRDTVALEPAAYVASVAPNRARLAKILGVVDARAPDTSPQFVGGPGRPSHVGRGDGYDIHVVRWEALPGVHAEGLMLVPTTGEPVADVVALPDADQTPEMIAGLAPGVAGEAQFGWRLARAGCRILIPTLVDRASTFSVTTNGARRTNQPHREFVYRPAFEMGRHVIGYEVQKVLAAVDWFAADKSRGARKVAVVGYGEGGVLALYAGALDTRIDVVGVSGAFGPREDLWREPIYRNVFGLLREFGDAEVASLVAPRRLVLDTARWPKVDGPPAAAAGEGSVGGAAPGRLDTPSQDAFDAEVRRTRDLTPRTWQPLVQDAGGTLFDALARDRRLLDLSPNTPGANSPPLPINALPDVALRQRRQVEEMQAFTQSLVRRSEGARHALWASVDRSSVEKFTHSTQPLRERFYNDTIGRFDHALLDPNPRTRKVYDELKYAGYEVMLDVWPDVFAYGVLLVPKDIKPGERRPVVVCQHGLEGRPQDVADPKVDNKTYHQFGCKLAERGFVVYAPQNPYIFGDRFRSLQRKLNPLGKQLFSVIIPQHEQTLNWLSRLPFVDQTRIAFYGLSYGGATAMRVPAVEQRYALSICSGNFNEWVWKTTSLDYPASYVGTGEYEMFEWDLGHTFNHAEMAALIAPRPFMVERGHRDGVAPDEWVAYEYAKVRRLYVDLNIPDRTHIAYFPGGHEIHGVATFEFLHRQLNWQPPAPPPQTAPAPPQTAPAPPHTQAPPQAKP